MAAKGKPSISASAIFGHVRVWARLLVAAIAIGAIPAVVHATTLATPFAAENSPLGLARNLAPVHAQAEPLQAPESPLESAFAYGQNVVDNAYATRGIAEAVQVGRFKLTQTLANHLGDVVKHGPFKGEAARPFLNSPHTIQEIMSGGRGVADPGGVVGALRWDVAGVFRGSEGTWELVVKDDLILHFNFAGK
jgi:stage V sporulation protein SpoVS